MSIHNRDHILRLIEQAAAALRRLRERLMADAVPAEAALATAQEARLAQRELLGEHAPLLQALDPASAGAMVREPERLAHWIALLRVEADALRLAGDPARAAALDARASALDVALAARA